MRIGIFAEFKTDYDTAMINGLRDGFRAIGQEAVAVPIKPEPGTMVAAIKEHGIDTVIEINRTKNLIEDFPKDVRHIAWIQDLIMDVAAEASTSDITYCLTEPESIGYSIPAKGMTGILVTGVDEAYIRQEPVKKSVNFCMVGYIPDMPGKHLLDMGLASKGSPTVRDAFKHCLEFNTAVRRGRTMHLNVREPIRELLDSRGFTGVEISGDMIFFLEMVIVRIAEREKMMDIALEVSKDLDIYGPDGWSRWEKYKPYYRHFVADPAMLAGIYARSRLTLHTNPHGFNMHSRVLDCMAAGGVPFIHASPDDHGPSGIGAYFEEGYNYFSFDLFNMKERAGAYLGLPQDIYDKMGESSKNLIKNGHLWRHRAEQIMTDIRRL